MRKATENTPMPATPREAGQISQFLMLGGWCRIWMVSRTCKFVGSLSKRRVCTGMLPKTRVFLAENPYFWWLSCLFVAFPCGHTGFQAIPKGCFSTQTCQVQCRHMNFQNRVVKTWLKHIAHIYHCLGMVAENWYIGLDLLIS